MQKFVLGLTCALLLPMGLAVADPVSSTSTETKVVTSDLDDGEYSSTTTKKSMDSAGNSVEVEKTEDIDGDDAESTTTVETESPTGSSTYSKEVERSGDDTSVTIEKEIDD